MPVATIDWKGDLPGRAVLIDQTLLPTEYKLVELETADQMWEAIKVLRVRGAPAIGVAAAYGLVLGVQNFRGEERAAFAAETARVAKHLRSARPTAVNLFWALDRMERRAAVDAGATVLKPAAKSLWGYGGVVQAPDGERNAWNDVGQQEHEEQQRQKDPQPVGFTPRRV